MGHLIRQYLAQLGFSQIVEAEDGQIALEKLGNEKVDFIISDWPMPNLGGIQLLKEVLKMEEMKEILFLIVPLLDEREKMIEAAKAGVTDYIVKPFNYNSLSAKISRILENLK